MEGEMAGESRLDKFLADCLGQTRTQVKELIRRGRVTCDGKPVTSPQTRIAEGMSVEVDGKPVARAEKYVYYLLNKPSGWISATEDPKEKTVLDLLPAQKRRKLFPVGRLDKDTEGLLLITDDGPLAHALLSPKSHVDKEYLALVQGIVTTEDVRRIAAGIEIGQGQTALPAKLEILETDSENNRSEVRLTIHEGKFHQVKRMIASCGKEVLFLRRIRMGALTLPEELAPGEYRVLTPGEREALAESCGQVFPHGMTE